MRQLVTSIIGQCGPLYGLRPRILDYLRFGGFVACGEWPEDYVRNELDEWDAARLEVKTGSILARNSPHIVDTVYRRTLEGDLLRAAIEEVANLAKRATRGDWCGGDGLRLAYEHWSGIEGDTFLLSGKGSTGLAGYR